MSERSLVAFTLLAQAAAGAAVAVAALDLFAPALAASASGAGFLTAAACAVAAVLGLALATSFSHLGSPGAAWRVLAGIRSSWLSREILSGLLFAASAGGAAALRLAGPGGTGSAAALQVVAAGTGLSTVYAMARVYSLRTVPAWRTWRTPLAFFAATVTLGALAVAAGLAASGVPAAPAEASIRDLATAGAAGFAAALLAEAARPAGGLRRGLLFAGLALTVPAVLGAAPGLSAGAAFALALAAETLGRYQFYVEGLRKVL